MANEITTKKNYLFSNKTLRVIGLISAFIGIMLLMLNMNVTTITMQLIAILLALVGVYFISTNVKRFGIKDKLKDALVYFLVGLILLALGIVVCIYASTISKWFYLILGVLIGIYGITIFIYFLIKKGSKVVMTRNIIYSVLLVATGVMVALLFKFTSQNYILSIGIVSTVTGVFGLLMY